MSSATAAWTSIPEHPRTRGRQATTPVLPTGTSSKAARSSSRNKGSVDVQPNYIYPHAAEEMWTCLKAMKDTVKKWPKMDAIDGKVTARAAAAAPSRAQSASRESGGFCGELAGMENSDTTVNATEESS